ncbi:MAG: sulfite exporter TauE/SafE family protein [Streptosporangiaceae bacterium]
MTLLGVLLAGAAAGFILGFAGAGGTIVGIPFYLYIAGVAPHHTFGTNALGVAAIGAVLLIIRAARGELRYGPGIIFAIPGLIGVYLGTLAAASVSGSRLVFLLGFVVLIVAGYIFYLASHTADQPATEAEGTVAVPGGPLAATGRAALATGTEGHSLHTGLSVSAPPAERTRPHRTPGPARATLLRTGPLGLIVGAVSGFFGIGGGFMIVPGTSWAAKIDLKAAAAASLIPITAFAALVGGRNAAEGSASLSHAGLMALIGIVCGGLGIWLSTRVPIKRFQQVFAVLLVLLGIYMIIFK